VSEDLERRLRDVPARVPSPDPAVTRRVRDRLLANVRLRAKWRSSYSAVLSIGVRPWVVLRQKGPTRFEAVVSTYRMLDGGAAQLQRYDRDSRQWKVAARAKLRPGSHGQETEAVFRAKLPKRTIVRAVVPATSTKPCNLAGFSNMMTVG
jgi:hypothetical protein